MTQFVCPECDGKIRTLGAGRGTTETCRQCGATSETTEHNF